jgi:hypothetical protein
MADRLGSDVVTQLRHGYGVGRSPEIVLVSRPWNVVVRWSGASLEASGVDRRTSHSTPWGYHQRVPIILYGPGFVRGGLQPRRSVDIADIAPTLAELLRFDFPAPNGEVLREALLPLEERAGTPKVVVLLAYDGGGWNLLDRWRTGWPFLRQLARAGTTYVNATLGSSPSVTAALHPTMSTGAYPRVHGLVDNAARMSDGTIRDVYFGVGDPRLSVIPTLPDAWDRANGNEPWTGLLAAKTWHLGMMGKGARDEGGDADVAVLWDREESRFFTNEDFYLLPKYLPDDAHLARQLTELDKSDGAINGEWLGNDLDDPIVASATPAFVRHQGEALRRIIRREPIGTDGLADFLAVELKPTDFGGHIWNLVAPEERHVLKAQDDVVRDLIRLLDEVVGRDGYVLAMTADHGLTPLPESVHGLRIHPDVAGRRIEEYFGADIVEKVTPAGIYLDVERIEEEGIRVEDVARFGATLRYGDVLPKDADPALIPEAVLERPVFAAMLPGAFLEGLSEEAIASFGESVFAEGNLTEPVSVPLPP